VTEQLIHPHIAIPVIQRVALELCGIPQEEEITDEKVLQIGLPKSEEGSNNSNNFKSFPMDCSSFWDWSVGCYFGTYCIKSEVWTWSVVRWILWLMSAKTYIMLCYYGSTACCCCRMIYSVLCILQFMSSAVFCCDESLACLDLLNLGGQSATVGTDFGAATPVCGLASLQGWGCPNLVSLTLILDQLICARFAQLSYG
jgi:hypothetical protein